METHTPLAHFCCCAVLLQRLQQLGDELAKQAQQAQRLQGLLEAAEGGLARLERRGAKAAEFQVCGWRGVAWGWGWGWRWGSKRSRESRGGAGLKIKSFSVYF